MLNMLGAPCRLCQMGSYEETQLFESPARVECNECGHTVEQYYEGEDISIEPSWLYYTRADAEAAATGGNGRVRSD